MHQNRIMIRDLPLNDDHGHPGFKVGDFIYHEGFAQNPDGSRGDNIAFRHRHPHFEIFWFRAGHGLIKRDCDVIEVGPKSLLILGPGDIHHWTETRHLEGSMLAVSEIFTSSSNFSLPFRELTSFLQPNGSRSIHLNFNEDELIRHVFAIMRESEGPSNFDQREVLKALLLILFSKINGFQVGRGARPRAGETNPLTSEFKQALLTQCPRLATVKEFAQFLNVSRSYLHRTVLRETGRAPSDFIHDRLVFEAKRLLLHTTNSPLEIAHHLGFKSASYFSSFFQRHTDLSPREFRSQRVA